MVSLTESQTRTRNDKDPLEHKLQGGCVVTMQPRKHLAAECREETTHLKQVSKRSPDAWVMLIVVNEGEKYTHTLKINQESRTTSEQAVQQLRMRETQKTDTNIWFKQVSKNGEELI